jgi:putative oxidoreductase
MTNNLLLLVARILISAIFIVSGAAKFADIGQTAGMIAQAGLPASMPLAWLAAAFELLTGLALLAGFVTRYAALLLALFCLFTAYVFHSGAINVATFSDAANAMLTQFNQGMMMKNLAMAGGLLALSIVGAGAWSLDARRAR